MGKIIFFTCSLLLGALHCTAQIQEPVQGNLIKEDFLSMLIDSLAISEQENDTVKIIRYSAVIPTEFQSIGLVERGSSYMLLALHYARSYSDSKWYPDVCYRAGMFMMGYQSKEYEAMDTSHYWYRLAIHEAMARKQYKVAGWAYKGQLQNVVLNFSKSKAGLRDSIPFYYKEAVSLAERAQDSELLIACHKQYSQYLFNIGDLHGVDSMLRVQLQWIGKMTGVQRYGYNKLIHDYIATVNNLDTLMVLRDAMEDFQARRTANRHKEELYAKDQKYEVSKTKDVLMATTGRLATTSKLLITSIGFLALSTSLLLHLFLMSKKNKKLSERNELLLREQSHRVKNNLQFISSLLSLQSQKVTSSDARDVLADSQRRINSVALLHRMLYEGENISNVEVTAYFKSLVEEIQYSAGREMHVDLDLPERLDLKVEKVTSLGLIMNELFTNSIKHVHESVLLRLRVHLLPSGNKFQLIYTDNGKGVSFKVWSESDTFGNQLIQMQSRQLRGTFEVSAESGFRYTLEFSA
jgi:two-component sensor histidine kinase